MNKYSIQNVKKKFIYRFEKIVENKVPIAIKISSIMRIGYKIH